MKGYASSVRSNEAAHHSKSTHETRELECVNKFYPPLLSTPTEFCAEAIARNLPIPNCALGKPKKLVIKREPPPLVKPATSRHLKNWQKWCIIWRETYNKLTQKRATEVRPPIMSSGECHRFKKEDQELFDRTLHSYYLDGFYVKNATHPDGVVPKAKGEKGEIKEVITKRYLRDFPEMKRKRCPNHVRTEMSLPPRKAPPVPVPSKLSAKSLGNLKQIQPPPGFNWEAQWNKCATVQNMKKILRCDIGAYGKTDPIPDNLIFKPVDGKDGPLEKIVNKKTHNKPGHFDVPQLIFSTYADDVDEGNSIRTSLTQNEEDKRNSKEYYNVNRGPILRIRSEYSQTELTFAEAVVDMPHFIKSPSSESTTTEEYLYDDDQQFSITTKSKDMKYIVLKNEGTTSIRYQWFRHPPNSDAQRMLADPTSYKTLRLKPGERELKEDSSSLFEKETPTSESHLKVGKKTHLEFQFSERAEIILPGQVVEYPIIFRSKKPGYFTQTLHLLTHPTLNTPDGRYYAVRLSGVCEDVALEERGNEKYEMECLNRWVSERVLDEESVDVFDSILHRALFEVTHTFACSLPYGRITSESIFYAHNQSFYYYCGTSEKTLELVRSLVEMLVPKERVEHLAECHLSIQSLYDLVIRARDPEDLYWAHLCTDEAEELLAELNHCMKAISKPRIFAWPSAERRKYTACYSNLVVTFDEILLRFDRVKNMYNSPAMMHIDEKRAGDLVGEWIRDEQRKERMLMMMAQKNPKGFEIGEVIEANMGDYALPKLEMGEEEFGKDEDECVGEYDCYWLAQFAEMVGAPQGASPPSKDEGKKEVNGGRRSGGGGGDAGENMEGGGSGGNIQGGGYVFKEKPAKVMTAMTLDETMGKRVKDERSQVMNEVRVQCFEDLMCDSIERMLSMVDSFNNLLDYKSSDILSFIKR